MTGTPECNTQLLIFQSNGVQCEWEIVAILVHHQLFKDKS